MTALLSLLTGWKRSAAIGLGVLLLLVGVYQSGVNAERRRGEAASLRAQLETVLADRRIAESAQLSAADKAKALEVLSAKLKEELNDLRNAVASYSEDDRCPASDAVIDLLYGPRP